MKDSKIAKVNLVNFKIHKHFAANIDSNLVALHGQNGIGKTTVLEAISLLSPGKGMLSNINANLNHKSDDEVLPYSNRYQLDSGVDIAISNIAKKESYDKNISINSSKSVKHLELLDWCDVLWFNNKMQYDLQSTSNRRNFFDRLTFAIFPQQAQLVKDYKTLAGNRIKSLESNNASAGWLTSIEYQMAQLSKKIADSRMQMAEMLNKAAASNEITQCIISIAGVEEQSNAEDYIVKMLYQNRNADRYAKRTTEGVHRSKINITDAVGKDINELSSGWQKMIFMGLINSAAKVITNYKKRRPILLFDEMVSFLDNSNTEKVMDSLMHNLSQAWITNCNPIIKGRHHVQEIFID